MTERTIQATATRREIADFIRSIPARLAGTHPDPERIGDRFRARLAWSWFSLVAAEFDRLGRGLPGDDGRVWPRNSPEYLAYGKGPASTRRGPGEMPNNRPGGPAVDNRLGRARGTGFLNKSQLEQWWAIYMPRRNALLRAGWPVRWAKAQAASYAWREMKKFGAKTKLGEFGKRRDQVLVDRGALRRSLQPGYLTEESYAAGDQQIFDQRPNELAVGSKNRHAARHHFGQGVPQRSLWPEEMPDAWWEEILDQGESGLQEVAELYG